MATLRAPIPPGRRTGAMGRRVVASSRKCRRIRTEYPAPPKEDLHYPLERRTFCVCGMEAAYEDEEI
jgi:hypothetical protein